MPTTFGVIHYGGSVLLLLACIALVARRGTVLLGLSVLNVFMVASATLFGALAAAALREPLDTFTSDQVYVVSYSLIGLLAMIAGIWLAWNDMPMLTWASGGIERSRLPFHVSDEIGWLTFCVGASAELIASFVREIPTLSTAIHCLATLDRIGLCMLLLVAINRGTWTTFITAGTVFGALSIVGSLASGFSFIRFKTVLPLAAIWIVSRGLTVTNGLRACVLLPLLGACVLAASSAWLETRDMIRSGGLAGLPLIEQGTEFFETYSRNLRLPTAESIMDTIMARVDMTKILAAQVAHQPAVEPYAFGDTLPPALYALIPRGVWPGKPIVAGGSAFVSRFTGLHWDANTSVGLPYPFELYANGGPLLVIVGLGVIGYVCGRLELRLFRRQRSLGAFWALSLVTAVLAEGGERLDVILPALVASALSAYWLGMVVEKWRGGTAIAETKRAQSVSSVF